MTRIALSILVVVSLAACGKKKEDSSKATSAPPPAGGSYLTVGAYCSAFCEKLCGTCGTGTTCAQSCKPRCFYGRAEDMILDGKDPKVGLALTQKELDACTALITKESCMTIASGQVPPACYTIQH
jgi:hypothetical protein